MHNRNIQQERTSAIKIAMTTKMQSSAKFASVKPSPATRSSHEVIRHLRQDLDRYKDENEELRSSITHITQSYLQEKQKVEDLLIKIQSLSSAPANAMRTVDKLVERQLENRQKELLRVVEDQRATIQKYQKYKICLSKNVCDLQDRLKATKQELHQTQKLLFTLQQGGPSQTGDLVPKKNESSNSENASNTSKKSNKIMHFELDEKPKDAHENQETSIPSRQARYLQASSGNQTSKVIRNGMQVAKSLAMARGEQKYDWLFNDEETPRQQPENLISERDSARYPTVNTGKKLVSSPKEGPGQSDRSDLLTMTSTNNKSIINQKMKHPQNNNYVEFSYTIQSNREGGDDSHLILNQQRSAGINDQGEIHRPSIVKKSLNNVKSIIRKAKDGLMASGQADSLGEMQRKFYSNPFEVNHEQVEIELEGPTAAECQKWSKGQFHGQYSVQEPLQSNKSLINDFDDQNPMDDDSN